MDAGTRTATEPSDVELAHEHKYCEIDLRMIKPSRGVLMRAILCPAATTLRRTALRAVDDERPPESDAEAERIAEMRARMEAMFGAAGAGTGAASRGGAGRRGAARAGTPGRRGRRRGMRANG